MHTNSCMCADAMRCGSSLAAWRRPATGFILLAGWHPACRRWPANDPATRRSWLWVHALRSTPGTCSRWRRRQPAVPPHWPFAWCSAHNWKTAFCPSSGSIAHAIRRLAPRPRWRRSPWWALSSPAAVQCQESQPRSPRPRRMRKRSVWPPRLRCRSRSNSHHPSPMHRRSNRQVLRPHPRRLRHPNPLPPRSRSSAIREGGP